MKLNRFHMFAMAAAAFGVAAAADAQIRSVNTGPVREKPVVVGTKTTDAEQPTTGGQYTQVPMTKSMVCNGTKYKLTVNTNPYPTVGMTGSKSVRIRQGSSTGPVVAMSGVYSTNQYIFPSLALVNGQSYVIEIVKGSTVATFAGLSTFPCP